MTLTTEDIITLTGGKLLNTASQTKICGVATLSEACQGEASFLGNEKYYPDYLKSQASLILVPPSLPDYPEGPCYIEVENPSLAFNTLVEHFLKTGNEFEAGTSPLASIHPSVQYNADKVRIGDYVVIEANASLGDGCDIAAGCFIGKNSQLGENCKLYPRAIVRERCILGNRVELQPGAIIGSDGFGYLLNKETGRYETVDQVGIVVLEDDVCIGANTTIDRARFGRTVVGEGSKIDNLVQIGHNCVIGKHTIIVAQTGIAGSTKVGNYVTIAAQCGIAGHLNIGDKSVLAAKTGVMSDLESDKVYWGTPSDTFLNARKQYAAIRRLPETAKQIRELQKQIKQLQEQLEAGKEEN